MDEISPVAFKYSTVIVRGAFCKPQPKSTVPFPRNNNLSGVFDLQKYRRLQVRAHWVRVEVTKPHRLAFIALAITLLVGILKAPQIQTALYWSIGWGSVFSVYVMFKSLSRITQSMVRVMSK